ncbi:hypothetical protein [Rhodococcus erythropolis]|uniref:hypothetical protein n=1 Tax=Rhodococcus erythropolis TaxID=1833 RepID=UPI000878B37E|nr:hypothetical protein [Rhodococcus erythropolis]OFV77051.1 hypothetical protein RERY_22140 [Rhodococcus erythropolis]
MTTDHPFGTEPDPVFVVDPQGIPTSALDLQQIREAGLRLMLDMAAHSADKDELDRIAARHLEALGSGELFRYVAAAALWSMTRGLLEPLLVMCENAGINARESLLSAARNPDHN